MAVRLVPEIVPQARVPLRPVHQRERPHRPDVAELLQRRGPDDHGHDRGQTHGDDGNRQRRRLRGLSGCHLQIVDIQVQGEDG